MRRAEAIWYTDGISYTDATTSLGDGTGSVVLSPADKIYVGYNDWLSGLLVLLSSTNSGANVVVETFDGRTDTWRILPSLETSEQLVSGHLLDSTAYNFDTSGMMYWGSSPYMWQTKLASSTFPEALSPPSSTELFWVRMRNVGTVPVSISRIIPAPYNTYADVESVVDFLGMQTDLDETRPPTRTFVRRRIRAYEDWLDNYTRRSWRLRPAINETHDLNAYGIRLNHRPVLFATEVSLWQGNQWAPLTEGRAHDYWISPTEGFLRFTWPANRFTPSRTMFSRYATQQESVRVDYVYGEDFDTSAQREEVSDIILKRVGAELTRQNTFAGWLGGNASASMSPDSRSEQWVKEAEEAADVLRASLII